MFKFFLFLSLFFPELMFLSTRCSRNIALTFSSMSQAVLQVLYTWWNVKNLKIQSQFCCFKWQQRGNHTVVSSSVFARVLQYHTASCGCLHPQQWFYTSKMDWQSHQTGEGWGSVRQLERDNREGGTEGEKIGEHLQQMGSYVTTIKGVFHWGI